MIVVHALRKINPKIIQTEMVESDDWEYHPNVFQDLATDDILSECRSLLSNQREYQGKVQKITRLSVVFTENEGMFRLRLPSYRDMKVVNWNLSPTTEKLRARLEERIGHRFDYTLFHLYEDGGAVINWHNDKEALDSDIASVSFLTRRRFLIRRLGATKGYDHEYHLGKGDFFYMKKGMQRRYEHCIPKEAKIKTPRINYTFRVFPE